MRHISHTSTHCDPTRYIAYHKKLINGELTAIQTMARYHKQQAITWHRSLTVSPNSSLIKSQWVKFTEKLRLRLKTTISKRNNIPPHEEYIGDPKIFDAKDHGVGLWWNLTLLYRVHVARIHSTPDSTVPSSPQFIIIKWTLPSLHRMQKGLARFQGPVSI